MPLILRRENEGTWHLYSTESVSCLRFPDATIITIEPDTDNYRQLRRNTKHLANVIPLRAGESLCGAFLSGN